MTARSIQKLGRSPPVNELYGHGIRCRDLQGGRLSLYLGAVIVVHSMHHSCQVFLLHSRFLSLSERHHRWKAQASSTMHVKKSPNSKLCNNFNSSKNKRRSFLCIDLWLLLLQRYCYPLRLTATTTSHATNTCTYTAKTLVSHASNSPHLHS